ncbi:Sodium/calcium exchanger protein-domain-containing protein [Chytriomyces cf. hyalinus JEL632]|nr:Sodium/calcium exchanger protein-domain-containing protein [Chytriomyces cf. hyalinus JEL632]
MRYLTGSPSVSVPIDAVATGSTATAIATHDHSKKKVVTIMSSLYSIWRRIIVFNILAIIFVPLGILSFVLKWGDIPTFVLNVCAIIPLAKLLDYATDQLSMRVGETIGGLLNATFGNAVELIVSILALRKGELRVVQASLIGSVLSNLLLVLGFCFLCGGLFPSDKSATLLDRFQLLDPDQANLNIGLLSVVFLGFIIPAAFHIASEQTIGFNPEEIANKTLSISRGTAIVLLVTYIAFLVFQLYSHRGETRVVSEPVPDVERVDAHATVIEEEEEEEEAETLAIIAVGALVCVTVVIGFCAEFLVDSLDGLAKQASISKTFIGIIILPIVGNAAEHVTAVSAAMRNKMNLVITVAVGSSIQISLLVAPVLVLIGWMIGQNLSLDFEIFESVVLFVTIFVTSTLISDGRTNWLEGWMLLASYVILAIAFFYTNDVAE